MAARILRLHHISLHVFNAEKVCHDLISKFKFSLFATRQTDRSMQLAFRKGASIFIVNDNRSNQNSKITNGELRITDTRVPPRVNVGKYNPDTPLDCLYDAISRYPVNTVSNVCFEVEDVDRSFKALCDLGCHFTVPPTTVEDESGVVSYTVVKSVVGNVYHTLIDKSKYKGSFLPGFEVIQEDCWSPEEDITCPITHFDHITCVCHRKTTHQVMRWYEELFGFHRFFITSNEDVDEGFVINQEGIGLRLTAMEYWKCSETGITLPSVDKNQPDCKFVIAESLPEQGGNQVDTFLEQHGGPGIQHVGLHTKNIVSTTQAMAEAGVQFYSPPRAYYTVVGKQQEIEEAGLNPQMLAQHGILLDTDLQQDPASLTTSNNHKRYLLQVFTKPIFAEDTFFLELIERRGATGFGEGNIRALWRSVQAHMEDQASPCQGEGSPKTVRTSMH